MMTKSEHRAAMYDLCIARITSPAENRMRTRTAKEQHAAAIAELSREQQSEVPEADDESAMQGYWPSNERPR